MVSDCKTDQMYNTGGMFIANIHILLMKVFVDRF